MTRLWPGSPMVPIVLAFVMGPIVERNLARGLAIHDGNIGFLLNEPITLTILALSVVAAIAGFRREKQRVADERVEDVGD